MLRLINPSKAEEIITQYASAISGIAQRYHFPAALLKAVLYKEMTQIDMMDPLADLAVRFGLSGKQDSSTGYAQIFGYVALNALNFAVDRGITDYGAMGISTDHRLDPGNREDVRMIWQILHEDPVRNMEFAALNLLSCAEEMTGRIDFGHYTDGEMKLILTRYNANTKEVTPYGEDAFRHYRRYLAEEGKQTGEGKQAEEDHPAAEKR